MTQTDAAPERAAEPRAETRAERFARELADLKIPDPAAARSALWLRLGGALMALGPVLAVAAYLVSHGTRDALVQRDALALGLGGVTASVVGSALFLRYSLTGFLRFWMARRSYDLAQFADRIREGDAGHDPTGNDTAAG
ncbi:hypothetical protein [Actinomadura parmotrematis]|uniref:Uncharacterized protein n=1 Tax=Actinomadura parmotrematis TaxID=2864039 RepID=A0ABS7FQQ2_9ACTN|nr:hypothetical protein [Actinomadura parmotrematis]MBW8482636.1 hypothetical protein [Actinomadura parmotrematis]